MFDLEYQVQLLPKNIQEKLGKYDSLSVDEKKSLKRHVLQNILTPGIKIKTIAAIVALTVSANQKFFKPEKQLELAATFMGGQLGYYTIRAIQELRPKVYLANGLEESLIAAGSGLLLSTLVTSQIDSSNITENAQVALQTYTIYVGLVQILPVLIRAIYADKFDKIYLKGK